jgi:hypothetical protein
MAPDSSLVQAIENAAANRHFPVRHTGYASPKLALSLRNYPRCMVCQ